MNIFSEEINLLGFINPKELRLGNLVINTYRTIVTLTVVDETMDCFKPISLTSELLEKAGFKRNGNCLVLNAYEWDIKTKQLYLEYDSTVTGSITVHLSHVKSLHQLQNLYFALTGEELAIHL